MNKIKWIIFKLPSFLCMCNVKESCDERSLLEERTLHCYEGVKDLAFIATPFEGVAIKGDKERSHIECRKLLKAISPTDILQNSHNHRDRCAPTLSSVTSSLEYSCAM